MDEDNNINPRPFDLTPGVFDRGVFGDFQDRVGLGPVQVGAPIVPEEPEPIRPSDIDTPVTPIQPVVPEPVPVAEVPEPEEQTEFTTPSGAVVDADGNVISTPERPAEPDFTDTPSQNFFDDLFADFQDVSGDLRGEETFRAQQEEQLGQVEAQKTMDDLNRRLRDLKREEAAIPLSIQREFEGRGVTAAGIAPVQSARLRNNAIQALTVSSLIDAANDQLLSAKAKVARSVEQRFGPLKADRDALLQNIDILLQSGELDRDETRRAEVVKAEAEREKEEIAKQEQEQADIWNVAVEAAPSIAGLPNGSLILSQIQNAKTKEEAMQIAVDNGAFRAATPERDTQIIEANGRQLLVDTQTGETIKDLGSAKLSDKAIERALEATEADSAARQAQADLIGSISRILANPDLDSVVGGIGTRAFSTSASADVRAQISQLKAMTALGRRELLKGSGAVSDFEAGMLADSANTINFAITDRGTVAMDPDEFRQEMKNLQGVTALKAGQEVVVEVLNPSTGEVEVRDDMTREDMNDAALLGFVINFQ